MPTVDIAGAYLAGLERVPFPAQEAFLRDPAQFAFAAGGVRSGKTEGAAEKFCWRLARDFVASLGPDGRADWSPLDPAKGPTDNDEPAAVYWILAPTYSLANEAWRKVARRLHAYAAPWILHSKDGVIWLVNGARIERKTAKHEGNIQAAKVRGALMDEACTWAKESWQQLFNRLSDSDGWLVAAGSPRPGSWVQYEWWAHRGSPDAPVSCHTWTTEENPHYPRRSLERARRQLSARWYARDFLASWENAADRVYEDYGAASIVDVDLSAVRVVDLAFDPGRRRPGLLFVADHPHGWDDDGSPVELDDGEAADVVVDEIVAAEIHEHELLRMVGARLRERGWTLRDVYMDPAGRQRTRQVDYTTPDAIHALLYNDPAVPTSGAGGVIIPGAPEQVSIVSGVRRVSSRIRSVDGVRTLGVARHLTDPAYLATLQPGIPGIHGSLSGYSYPDPTKVRGPAVELPIKDNVHDNFCLAEGEEVLTLRGWVPVEQVHVGDLAWSVALDGWGWRPVAAAAWSGVRRLVRVETERGAVTTTTDHKVMTARGWLPMGAVTAGCMLIQCGHADRPDSDQRDVPRVPRDAVLPLRQLPEAGRGAATSSGVRGGAWAPAQGAEVARPPQEREQDGQPALQPRVAASGQAFAAARHRRRGVLGGRAGCCGGVAQVRRGPGVARGARAADLAEPRAFDGVVCGVRRAGRNGVAQSHEVLRRNVPSQGDAAPASVGGADRPQAADQQWAQPPDGEALLQRLRVQLHGAAGEAPKVLLSEVLQASEAGFGSVYTLTVLGAGNYVTRGGFLHRNCDALRYLVVCKRPAPDELPQVDPTGADYLHDPAAIDEANDWFGGDGGW